MVSTNLVYFLLTFWEEFGQKSVLDFSKIYVIHMYQRDRTPWCFLPDLTLYYTVLTSHPGERSLVGKGENVGNQHFLLVLQCFLPYQRQKSSCWEHLVLSSANALNLVKYNIFIWWRVRKTFIILAVFWFVAFIMLLIWTSLKKKICHWCERFKVLQSSR